MNHDRALTAYFGAADFAGASGFASNRSLAELPWERFPDAADRRRMADAWERRMAKLDGSWSPDWERARSEGGDTETIRGIEIRIEKAAAERFLGLGMQDPSAAQDDVPDAMPAPR